MDHESKIEFAFAALVEFCARFDPVKLLAQVTLTCLSGPEDQSKTNDEDAHSWFRWIEFLAGVLLSKEVSSYGAEDVDGQTISELEVLLKEYDANIATYLIVDGRSKFGSIEPHEQDLVVRAKMYSAFVRGETYPYKFLEHARDVYGEHGNWFLKNLGFSIQDAISFLNNIHKEVSRRINDDLKTAREFAKTFCSSLDDVDESTEVQVFCAKYFGEAEKRFDFSEEEILKISGSNPAIARKILGRLSQEFGYKNQFFPNCFESGTKAPWDHNTIYERPFIKRGDRYFAMLVTFTHEALYRTFHYDLLADKKYKPTYDDKRGKWIERRVAKTLEGIFPKHAIFLNPLYPNEEELCDVLVLHDRKVYIFQCKAKQMAFDSKMGNSYEKIKEDIELGVKAAFNQGVKALDYLSKNDAPEFISGIRKFTIDKRQVSNFFIVTITGGHFQSFITRIADIASHVQFGDMKQAFWALSLADFEIVTSLFSRPSEFIHYTKNRLAIEKTDFALRADELELLGHYFSEGLNFEYGDKYKGYNYVMFDHLSDEINEYCDAIYQRGIDPSTVKKPAQTYPPLFASLIGDLEKLKSAYRTDCAMRLLDLNSATRQKFCELIQDTKSKIVADGKHHNFSMTTDSGSLGFTYIIADLPMKELFKTLERYCIGKKMDLKKNEWVGLGKIKNSENEVDVAIYINFDCDEIMRNYKKNKTS